MLCKEVKKSDQPGVVEVFRSKSNTSKLKKHSLPIIFYAITKKGAPAQYIKYQDLKKEFPFILIDFFEKKLRVTNLHQYPIPKQPGKDQGCQTQKKEQVKESKDLSKELKQLLLKEKESINSIKEVRQKQVIKQMARQKDQKELSMKESLKTREIPQSRPVRSCRYRNDPYRKRQDFQIKQEFREMSKNIDQEEMNQQAQQRQSFTEDEQFKRKSYKKILDYDNMIEDLGLFNLVSPAVIPTSKSKTEAAFISYHIPARINFKQPDREQYSSEEFKESEESQFVLDERGKEKRRREKMLREQEKLNKRRKFKKIKKKKKVATSNRQ